MEGKKKKGVYRQILAVLLGMALTMPGGAYGSADTSRKVAVSVRLNHSLSHTGINMGLIGNFRYKKYELYAGPEMALSDSYIFHDPRKGFTVGGRYYTHLGDKSASYLFVNYQRVYYRPFLEDTYPTNKFNHNTEFTLGLGQDWKVYRRWQLGLSIGYGKYFDVFQDLVEGTTAYFDDGTALIRFSITHKLP